MVWIEYTSKFVPFAGIEVRNEKYPGQAYRADQHRISALNKAVAPKLRGPDKRSGEPGMPAYCLNVSDEVTFSKLLDWYAKLPSSRENEVDDDPNANVARDLEELRGRSGLKETVRQALIDARLGQGKFRSELIDYWKICPITR